MTRIVANIKDKADADIIYRVIKKFNARVKMMNDRQWEDYVLGQMAAESEREGDTVSRTEVSKWFKKHGVNF